MIRTVKLEVNAANPQLPLMPSEVFEDSAATFVIIGVPRAHGKQSVTGVTVGVVNPDGQSVAIPAVRDGSAWVATVHAADIGGSGKVTNGVIISASGKDENDANVEAWIIGAGDLVVMQHDGTVVPGERLNRVNWFETAPAAPKIGSIAPVGGVIKIYTSAGWVPFGSSVTLDDTVTETSANGVKSSGIWSFVKGLLPSWLTPSREEPPTQASVAAKYVKPSDGIPLSDLKPTTFPPEAHTHTKSEITDFPTSMPPTAHSHASDNWFTSALEAVKSWASGVFAAITHSHASDSWFTSALSDKLDKTYGTATDLTVIEPLTIQASTGGNSAMFSVGTNDGVLYISGPSDLNITGSTRTLNQIDDKLNELDDGKANMSDFSPTNPADYVTNFVQQSAALQAQIKSVARSLIRTAVADFDPDEQSFADLVNILKNIGA